MMNSLIDTFSYSTIHSLPEVHSTTEEWISSSTGDNDTAIGEISNVTMPSIPHDDKLKGLLSDATAYVIQTVVEVGLLLEVVTAGIVMNAISMMVFLRQGLSDRINLCLFSLAISDTGYIVFQFITRLYSIFRFFDPLLGLYWQLRCLSLVGVIAGFMATSNCLTLLISLERCLLVISPLKARTMLSTRVMAVIVVITFCICLSCPFPRVLKYDVIAITDTDSNVIKYRSGFSQFYVDNRDVIEYLFNAVKIIIPLIVFTGVVVATSIIAVRMHAVAAWRQESANVAVSTERREASLTQMLFVICIIYTICNVPAVILPFVVLLVPEFDAGKIYHNTFLVCATLVHLMASINSSFNLVVYYAMSTRFRETCKQLFTQRKA